MLPSMPSWDADQYLRFEAERTRPCAELAARVAITPKRIVDLGCGPGNSTAVLAQRWPDAALAGMDSSPAMIEAARKTDLQVQWSIGEIEAWSMDPGMAADLVFSNAALHWVADHPRLLPALLKRVSAGGALAFQMPFNADSPAHTGARDLAASPDWRAHFPKPVRTWSVLEPAAYFDILAPHAARVDIWTTEYWQVMPDLQAVIEWYKGTGLRPYLDALPETLRPRFLADYRAAIAPAFPVRPSGKVLFPFKRLFSVAYKEVA